MVGQPQAPTLKSDLIGDLIGALTFIGIGLGVVLAGREAEGWSFAGLGAFMWGSNAIIDLCRRR